MRLAGSLYIAAAIALAALAAWPVYRSGAFLMLVVAASVLGAGIAVLVAWRRWGGWAAAGLLAAVILVAGVPLAVPSRVGGADQIARGLGELAGGLVFGWKDLLTVDLPVGSYRNLLVPALVVFLVGTTVGLLLAWRSDAIAVWAVPVALSMTGFGLLFGRTDVSAPVTLGPVTLAAPVETAVGLGSLASGVLWLAWRTRAARVRALRRAAESSGVRLRRAGRVDGPRFALGVGMVVIATAAALLVPGAAASADRTVLREATGPRIELSRAISPLSAYRAAFTDAAVGQVLFSATGAAVPARLRLAVLDRYDGTVFRTGTDAAGASFVRMPGTRTAAPGAPVDISVVIGTLEGIWMPSVDSVAAVSFGGGRSAALADGFYVSDELSAAVQTAGFAAGDQYRLEGTTAAPPALAAAAAPGGVEDGPEAPASLRSWVEEHAEGTDGAALDGLVTLLRQRGYLSHALTEDQSDWQEVAGVTAFAPSPAGHSLARIDELFTALLDREQDPRAAAEDDYVAAIGDDEQFSVAVALIAHHLGFPARIVVGARTTSDDPDLAVCDGGTCRSEDLSAWVEVRSADGVWIPIDVTPQHAQAPSQEVTDQPDPTIGTEVRPDIVDEVQPPKPAQEDSAVGTDRPQDADVAWVWAALRTAAIALALAVLLIGPFVLVMIAKAVRRRARRTAGTPSERIAGGWDEYLDAATDARTPAPVAATRTEIAAAWEAPAAAVLARGADAAVFSAGGASAEEAAEFWRIVDAERGGFVRSRWQRLRAAVSLRSFFPVGPRRASSHTERGSRRAGAGRQTA